MSATVSDPSEARQALARGAKVILIGQMGAGKSTVARLLAASLPGYGACDLDLEIEARGRPIARIFEEDGEAGFRAIEAEVLAQVLARPTPLVVATGGGAPCQPGAIERMRAAGLVIWLTAPPDVLALRLVAGQAQRPLVAGLDLAQAERFLSRQLEVREPLYARAHLVIDASPPLDVVASSIDRIVSGLVDETS